VNGTRDDVKLLDIDLDARENVNGACVDVKGPCVGASAVCGVDAVRNGFCDSEAVMGGCGERIGVFVVFAVLLGSISKGGKVGVTVIPKFVSNNKC
jgi:hypothetical protein